MKECFLILIGNINEQHFRLVVTKFHFIGAEGCCTIGEPDYITNEASVMEKIVQLSKLILLPEAPDDSQATDAGPEGRI
jgi:hypothetical protein